MLWFRHALDNFVQIVCNALPVTDTKVELLELDCLRSRTRHTLQTVLPTLARESAILHLTNPLIKIIKWLAVAVLCCDVRLTGLLAPLAGDRPPLF